MISIAAVDLVLRVSGAGVGGTEVPANTNAGPFVEPRLAIVGLPKGNPWCAADVAYTGHLALEKDWPLPLTGGCQALYEYGAKHGLIETKPERGDVFVVWHPELSRFGHTGFIIEVNGDGSCKTHEGNTSGAGSREGWIKAARVRHFKPEDRFIRWTRKLP